MLTAGKGGAIEVFRISQVYIALIFKEKYLKGRATETDRLGARSTIWVCHVESGTEVHRPFSATFQGTLTGDWINSGMVRA